MWTDVRSDRPRWASPRVRPRLVRVVAVVALVLSIGIPGMGRPAVARPDAAAASAETIRRFDTTERVIVLTFDAGSDRGYADTILDALSAQHIAASFGMTGTFATATT